MYTFHRAGAARAIAAVALIALVGCSGHGRAPTAAPASGSNEGTFAPLPTHAGQCSAQPAQFAVGQASTATVMESARARSGAQMARLLRPGQITTKEFNAQRLNLQVDASGRILAATCG